MDGLETPYDDEAENQFIYCDICAKSIRGDTLYKIHLTTSGHIKKEDIFVAEGKTVRQHIVPDFEDILQYLHYLKLNEPIIGLNYLEEIPCSMTDSGPRYTCRLCNSTSNLPDTVHHLIGRKHRQKYLEVKRPDLVTWDKQTMTTQSGKLIRARAEIIERQDGRGTPVSLKKNRKIVDEFNFSRVRPWQNRDRNIHPAHRDAPPLLPELTSFNNSRGRRLNDFPNPFPAHPEDHYMLNPDRDGLSHDQGEEDLLRTDYREGDMHRERYMEPDYRTEYEKDYTDDLQRGQRRDGISRFGSREQMQRGQAQGEEYYPSGPRGSYPEKDLLKEFYTEEVRQRQAEYQSPQDPYPQDSSLQWPLDRESDRRPRSSEPEANRMRFPMPSDSNCSRNQLVNVIKDYRQEIMKPCQEEAVVTSGPSRASPTRLSDINRTVSDIPEPFMRFLQGHTSREELGKRKRKSRFSDATKEEMTIAQEMFRDDFGPPRSKFGSRPTSASSLFGNEIRGRQNPDHYPDSQSPCHVESYQREFVAECAADTGSVFDMLKNIEIENAEEADFLKNKLFGVLREFEAKKQEKTMQNIQGRAVIPQHYNSLRSDSQESVQDDYDWTPREDSDMRRPKDLYSREDHRRRDHMHPEHVTDERLQEYHHPVRGEPRRSNRSPYKEDYGWDEISPTQHPNEPAHYPERYQTPVQALDYKPTGEEFFESHRSASPQHMERGPRMQRGPQYKSSLDKITSTLLELVARK
ncbi:uncharacterized protein LOC115427953 isoform X2 [Sphaeramia orbicularis]|uniref:uncharacterized protein LOC115427953 isoform X2 n=1 Tax=Sphaeramia orbicularis TaxID=375764 RepID=UPI0011803015|nr:uncharacterized protein LOC115427953 isoform X2 [Sphaeramia orbicularis]